MSLRRAQKQMQNFFPTNYPIPTQIQLKTCDKYDFVELQQFFISRKPYLHYFRAPFKGLYTQNGSKITFECGVILMATTQQSVAPQVGEAVKQNRGFLTQTRMKLWR